jgi:hypothetical protein
VRGRGVPQLPHAIVTCGELGLELQCEDGFLDDDRDLTDVTGNGCETEIASAGPRIAWGAGRLLTFDDRSL